MFMNITTSQHNLNTTSRLETPDLNTQVIICKGACKGDNVFVEIVVEHKKKMYWGYSTGHRLFQTVNIAAESPSTVRRRVVLVLLLVLLLCCVVLCCVVLWRFCRDVAPRVRCRVRGISPSTCCRGSPPT